MLDGFLLAECPLYHAAVPVGHASQDNFGYLQPRVAEANYVNVRTSGSESTKSLTVGYLALDIKRHGGLQYSLDKGS